MLQSERKRLDSELQSLVAAAERHPPVPGAARRLSLWLDKYPEFLRRLGSTQDQIREYLLQGIGIPNALFRESTRRESKLLESELAGPDASPMVRVLANQAAIALLMLRKAEIAVGPGTIDAASVFAAKLAESAQRQLLNTLRSIAMIQIALATARSDTPPAALE